VDLVQPLGGLQSLEALPGLVAALGHEPLFAPVPGLAGGRSGSPEAVFAVGRAGEFPWFGISGRHPERAARQLSRRLAAGGRIAGVMALDPQCGKLVIAVSLDRTGVLTIDVNHPTPAERASLARLAGVPPGGALAFATRAAGALAKESAGRRFFREFKATLDRMAQGLPSHLSRDDRRSLALLQLTRVLFLYFVQAKGWLNNRGRFLSEEVDDCLSHRRGIHRHLLRPLFFGALNQPAGRRGRAAARFGAVPFLNGGLFEPHPLERAAPGDIPNDHWRDAFDHLFERFHFTLAEEASGDGIAPDMLGRVFEGVMAPDLRRATGTYYTPAVLVRRILDAALATAVAGRLRCPEVEAERRLADGDPGAAAVIGRLTVLDPAVGSGAFLLGALDRWSAASRVPQDRVGELKRAILRRNLFGVDQSATAVRLTQLRLWLAVIADDRSDRPEQVRPLPNLDCLVRQGDSLFDPVGSGTGSPSAGGELAARIARTRRQLVMATGTRKGELLGQLRRAEAAAAAASISAAERGIQEGIAACLSEARGTDLFGQRRGLDRPGRERLTRWRMELRALRHARRRISREGEVPWFHFQGHFADIFAAGGFDLVVGNPPWLRAESLPATIRQRLAGRYRWWRGGGGGYANRPDLAVAFLERALELGAPGGVVAMLIPAKIAKAGYGAAARHGLASGTTLSRVADLTGRPDAMFEATVYPLAIVTRKVPPPAQHRLRAHLETSIGPTIDQAELRGGGPWILDHPRAHGVVAELSREHPRLGDRVACGVGVKTGANPVFLQPPADLEPDLIRWAVRGRDVGPFQARPRVRMLWTHGSDGRPLETLPGKAVRYLIPHLRTLRSRADFTGGPPWTLFRTRAATARYRVVWADLARRLTAVAFTSRRDARCIPLNSCYVAVTPTAGGAERIAAWLNSTWSRAIARLRAPPAANGFSRFNARVLEAMPFPDSILADADLSNLARAGRAGAAVQHDLDDLVAKHLGLSATDRHALRAVVDPGTHGRR